MGKRRRRRKSKLLRFSPYIVAIGLGVGYIVKSFGGEIVEMYYDSSLHNRFVTESEEVSTEEPIINTLTPEDFEEVPKLEEEPEETFVEEEVVEEEKEVISNELLSLGYEFQNIAFDELCETNKDACGWIIIDGTKISYPIVNATDEENAYYAHHDLEGNESNSGTIYVDTRCSSLDNETNDLSDVTLVYGHHMKYGKMFANLCNYMDKDYIDDHQFGVIYTPDGYAYKVTFFAGMRFSGASDEPIYRDSLEDEDVFNEYIDSLKENSSFTSDVEVNYGDKIIGLVTCEYSAGLNSDYRYGLFGVLEKQYTNELQMESSIENQNDESCALK